jgi:hypothetical protein
MNRKTRRANKKQEFDGFPYNDYTVGMTHAGRAAIEALITKFDLCYRRARGDAHDGECTAADLVREVATKRYRLDGMPHCVAGSFEFTLQSGLPLTILIDQHDRLLACWVASEADTGTMPAVYIDPDHCAPDFLDRNNPHTLQ